MSTRPSRGRWRCAGTVSAETQPIPSSIQPCLPLLLIRLSVDQLVALDPLLRVEVDDRRHEDSFLVGASWIDRQRLAELHRALALVDVTVKREQRLVLVDQPANGRRADRAQRTPAVHQLEI